VLNESGPTCFDVAVRVESLTIVEANVALCDTCNRYVVAPLEAFHVNVGFGDTPVAPLAGDTCDGANGGAVEPVVKLQTLDQELVPPVFVTLMRQ